MIYHYWFIKALAYKSSPLV